MPDCDVMGEFKNPLPDDAVTHGVFSKVAVNVVSVAGVEITCVWAPPSDQESNCHVWPARGWGELAPIVRTIPTTPVKLTGVVLGWPSRVICNPTGSDVIVMLTVRGRTSRVTWLVKPHESLTVRCIRKNTFESVSMLVGTVNEPLVTPLVGCMNG